MGTSVQVKPLCGVYNENPLCYLVSVDGFNFLVDCGWNDHFDPSLLQPLSRVASSIDAVLLSHPDTLHLGALPYAVKQFGLSAPVYSTEPVHRLGLLTMYDQYASRKQVSDFDLFTLDDIDSAFQNVNRLTYSQNFHLSGKGEGIVIAPHVAGHLLGGTVWKITKDGEDVIYAVDFNHRKERLLNGTVLESFVRPAVLITDAYNALNNQPSRRQRDQEFLDAILKTLRADGNVLLPVDTAGRVLELLLILEQYWTQHHLTYPIFFLTCISSSTIDYVKSFLEWMSDSIAKSFEHTRDNAFLLKNVTLLINKSALDKVPDGPKIVLASMASLEAGFSHDIFVEWAPDVKNLVLFTERGQFGTLARMLQADPPPKAVKVTMSKRVPLVGDELAAYEEEQNRIKKEEALKASLIKEEESKAPHGSHLSVGDPMAIDDSSTHAKSDVPARYDGVYGDIFTDGFTPPSSSIAPMFPFYENSSEWDDFGEVINPDDYVIKEEDMDQGSLQVGGDPNGNLDEGSASLILDTAPSKVVSYELTVQVKSSLLYMDYEGRSDGRSVKSILAHVAPLKLVLVHGSAEATEHLKQHCLKHVCPHVYAPQIEETIDVTSDLCAYKVQLSEKLMSNVLLKKLGDHEIAWVDAEVGKTDSDMLSVLPLSTPAPPHKSVLVGDIKMADFKQFLASKGVPVEFGGGALRCGEYVTLRKIGDATQKGSGAGIQPIIIEGPLSEEYYKIREYLYSQFYSLKKNLVLCGYHVVHARCIQAVHFGFGRLGFGERKRRERWGERREMVSIWAVQHTFGRLGWVARAPCGIHLLVKIDFASGTEIALTKAREDTPLASSAYLVQSQEEEGDLLQVQRYWDWNNPDGDLCKTSKFFVFKLLHPVGEAEATWVPIHCLGNQALFLGDNYSLSVQRLSFPIKCLPNCIYCTQHYHSIGVPYVTQRIDEDFGIFDIQKESFESCHTPGPPFGRNALPPIWCVPNMKGSLFRVTSLDVVVVVVDELA
ncbi:hypothetical protein RHSIM_Rhsim03G0187300 [Rhododendron simsii]|uniref:Cleavage and polyadenylation specificity factor subunit 2 n=1 Tax=Rhododendron simsii TaxID=118357 RepID=A0A834LPC3_RHOSS|nr:hypothetical protein RHSIM_Rhsim03G0187300 [Rhododendron simsii]